MPLFELRQYKVRDGRMDDWIDLMEGEILPYIVSRGMVFTASFRSEDDPSVYIWIRRFESEEDRARLYEEVSKASDGNLISRPGPASFSSARTQSSTGLCRLGCR